MHNLSIVVPAKNEQDTLATMVEGVLAATAALPQVGRTEIVFVDDGSTDASWPIMQDLARKHVGVVRAFRMRRNFGKATALEVGFRAATGDIIFTMDADLQDDPKEIGRFLEKLDCGYDLVSGWKQKRNDPPSKTIPSKLFNAVTSAVTGVKLQDFNCGFKAYRRCVIERVRLYGELHRYIPVLAQDLGFRIGEIPVEHHPRRHGVSKYGIERYIRGLLDLITVQATTRYLHRPGHLFGGLGLGFGFFGILILTYLTIGWFMGHPIESRPLFFLGMMLTILAVQMISIGVIGELLIRLMKSRDVFDLVSDAIDESRPSARPIDLIERRATRS